MTHQWIPHRDDRGGPADLCIFVKRKPVDDTHITIENELARVWRERESDYPWKWEAAGSSGKSFSLETARRHAEAALREAGIEF